MLEDCAANHLGGQRRHRVPDLATLRLEGADEAIAVWERLDTSTFACRQRTMLERVRVAASRHVVELRRDRVRREAALESAEQRCAVGATDPREPRWKQ